MKNLLAALLLALSGTASAASVAIKPPVGITGNPASATGWTTASNFVGNFSAASFSGAFTTNVGGKAVTMPATMRMAANAPRFAVAAVRLNPAALVGSAVAAWLLSAGIQWVNGQWMAQGQPVGVNPLYGGASSCSSMPVPCAELAVGSSCESLSGGVTYTQTHSTSSPGAGWLFLRSCGAGNPQGIYRGPAQSPCNAGYTFTGGQCVPTELQPATDADFAALEAAPLPDAVASEIADVVPLPMENPQFNPPYVDEPLGEPYVDPVTGKRYQDMVRVTPQADGKTADVQTTKQEVDEAGEPVTDPASGVEKPPEKQDDFCKQNPDSLACMEKGEPDEIDLETRSIGSMVSPVAVGGAGHCMADKTLAIASMGRSITFTYKPICDLASMVRPLILALAWLLAGWIMVGAVKEN